jgi:predicted Kef-type K+ transport protein
MIMKNTKKGQLTIYGLIVTFIVIVMVGSLMPAIYTQVVNLSRNATENGDPTTASIAMLVPTVLMVCVLMIPVVYILAGRSQRQDQEG